MNALLLALGLLATLPAATAQAQSQQDLRTPLARVGKTVIDRARFLERYEHAVWIGKERSGTSIVPKHAFLLALIAEELLAQEGARRGLDQERPLKPILQEIERMLLLDALYRQEVQAPVQLTEAEIDSVARCRLRPVTFAYLTLPDSLQAVHLYQIVQRSHDPVGTWDSLAQLQGQAGQYKTARWGELAEAFENLLYVALKAPGETGPPVRIDSLYYVVQLRDQNTPVLVTPDTWEQVRYEAGRILRQRRERARFQTFMARFGQGKAACVRDSLFYQLAEAIQTQLALQQRQQPSGVPLRLASGDWEGVRFTLSDALEQPLIEAATFQRSLDYVLDRLASQDFAVQAVEAVPYRLRQKLWELITEEFLLEEARARGLEYRFELQQDLQLWRTAYLARGMQRVLADSLRQAWQGRLWLVKLCRATLASEAEASVLRRQWEQTPGSCTGASVDTLDYRLAPTLGLAGELAAVAAPGSVLGPFAEEQQWRLYRLLDRKQPKDPEAAFQEAAREAVNAYVARLAETYRVTIDLEALEATRVIPMNMVLVRLLGFGYRLLAAPTVYPLVEWFDRIDKRQLYAPL